MSFHPQTPQSPSQTSPSISDPSTSLNSSMTSTTTNLPTPAHSVTGSCLPSEMNPDIIMGDDTPQKRKRALEDGGDRDHKKAHIEDRRLGIENLHMDVGEKYLLCRTRKASLLRTCTYLPRIPGSVIVGAGIAPRPSARLLLPV